jgi:hypothetical protein
VGQVEGAEGIAVAPDGTVVVADTENHRLQRFSATGQFVELLGSHGSGPDEFDRPLGVAIGVEGEIYVADSENHRVQVLDPTGGSMAQWGKHGTRIGEFDYPQDIAVLPDGKVAVVDDYRLQLFDSDGTPVDEWDLPPPDGDERVPRGDGLRRSVGALPSGSLVVTGIVAGDTQQATWRFDQHSDAAAEWSAAEHSDHPASLVVAEDGTVLVAHVGDDTLHRHSKEGAHLGLWPTDEAPIRQVSPNGDFALADDGSLYYTAHAEGVRRYDADGHLTHTWGASANSADAESDAASGADSSADHDTGSIADSSANSDPDSGAHSGADSTAATDAKPVGAVADEPSGDESRSTGPTSPPSDAWRLQVFDNPWLSGVPVTTTHVAEVDLDWGLGAPVAQLLSSGWSVRLERELPLRAGPHVFEIGAGGSVRLWLGDDLLADLWEMPDTDWRAHYEADGPVAARLEFADRGGPASIRLDWHRTES